MKKKNEDLLSDIENDISGDWEDIQKTIKLNEKEKEIEDIRNRNQVPQRFNYPNFKQFYDLLLEITLRYRYHNDINNDKFLYHNFSRIFDGNRREELPVSFDKVWEIFCSPRKYKCASGIYCKICGNRFDIFYEENRETMAYYPPNITQEMYDHDHVTLKRINVRCPECANHILVINSATMIGIFKHFHVDEKKEYDYERKNMEIK